MDLLALDCTTYMSLRTLMISRLPYHHPPPNPSHPSHLHSELPRRSHINLKNHHPLHSTSYILQSYPCAIPYHNPHVPSSPIISPPHLHTVTPEFTLRSACPYPHPSSSYHIVYNIEHTPLTYTLTLSHYKCTTTSCRWLAWPLGGGGGWALLASWVL